MKTRLITFLLFMAMLVACGGDATPTAMPMTGGHAEQGTMMPSDGMNAPAAASATVGDLTLTDIYARPGTMGEGSDSSNMAMAGTSAIYMNVANKNANADKLLKAEATVAKSVETHTVIDNNGVKEMRPVEGIEVPANGSVALKPGSFHIMLIGLTQDLKVGDTFDVTFTFEKAGPVKVSVPVRPVDMGGMGAAPSGNSAMVGDLTISEFYARPGMKGDDAGGSNDNTGMSAPTPGVSAVFATITNKGANADKLIKAESTIAKSVELHNVFDNNGIKEMRPVENMEVPANGTLVLKPGSYHVMLIGLSQDLKVDDSFEVTLTFEKAGMVKLTVPVKTVVMP